MCHLLISLMIGTMNIPNDDNIWATPIIINNIEESQGKPLFYNKMKLLDNKKIKIKLLMVCCLIIRRNLVFFPPPHITIVI